MALRVPHAVGRRPVRSRGARTLLEGGSASRFALWSRWGVVLEAYVDESLVGDRMYVMAAVVVRPERIGTLIQDLLHFAHRERGRLVLHATHTTPAVRRAAQQLLMATKPALMVVARAPILRGYEHARQICVAELMVRLHHGGVDRVVMDTRDDLERPGKRKWNNTDHATVRDLRAAGELPPDFRVRHASDYQQPGLWLPDLVAHAVTRSIRTHSPSDLALLSPRLHLVEASLLPPAQRPAPALRRRPAPGVQELIDRHWLEARAAQAQSDRTAAYEAADDHGVQAAGAAIAWIRRRAAQARQPPALETVSSPGLPSTAPPAPSALTALRHAQHHDHSPSASAPDFGPAR